MSKALEDIIKDIEYNYSDLIKILEIDRNKNNIIIKIKIFNLFNKEINSKDKILEISFSGIRVLDNLDTIYYESIESLLHSIAPKIWEKYFESKIIDQLIK